MILLDNLIPNGTVVTLNMLFSTNNSTFDSGAHYNWAYNGYATGPSAVQSAGAIASLATLTGSQSGPISGSITFNNVNSTSATHMYTGNLSYFDDTGYFVTLNVGGSWKNGSTSLEAIRFFMSSGGISSGTFKVYGISKS